MKILICGLEGFIGVHLAKRLLNCGHEVVGLGNLSRDTLQYFPEVRNKIAKFINGDILDRKTLDFTIRDHIDVVINCAAVAGVSNYHKKPVDTIVTNGIGTHNVIDLCHKNQIPKVIILSSSEIYGDSSNYDEIDGQSLFTSVHNLRLTYSISKLFGDQLAIAYHKQYGMDICSLRPFGIFGGGQTGEGAIQIFVRKAVNNQPIPIVNDGSQMRCWCYIDDFVDAVDLCIHSDKIAGQILNIGDPGNYMTILELAKKIINLSESKSEIIFVNRDGVRDSKYRQSNISLAKKLIGFENKIPFDKALLETIKWYREHPSVGEDISF
jgi:dTDP-glucose 4,6-dehydratase